MKHEISEALAHWNHVAPLLTPPATEADYNRLVEALDTVLDTGGADEANPLARLADYLGDLIEAWEAHQVPMPAAADGVDMLKHLMAEHNLKQSDLPEIGSQGVVSEILGRQRALNIRHIKALSKRFGVPEQAFV